MNRTVNESVVRSTLCQKLLLFHKLQHSTCPKSIHLKLTQFMPPVYGARCMLVAGLVHCSW